MRLRTSTIFLAGMILGGCGEAAGPTVAPEPAPPTPPVTPAPVAASVRILVDTTFADIQSNGHRVVYVDIGLPRALKVLAADAAGSEIKSPSLIWVIADGGIASVAADGTLNGIGPGTTVLAVASGTVTDTVTVTVSPSMSGKLGTTSTEISAEVPLLPPLGYLASISPNDVSGGTPPFRWTYSIDGQPDSAAFRFTPSGSPPSVGEPIVLPALPVGRHVVTLKITDRLGSSTSGQQAYSISSPARAYGLRFLGTLGGDDSNAAAISQNGIVVGDAKTATGEQHAVMWRNGAITDLTPDLPGSSASGVNGLGQIVGSIGSCFGTGNQGFLISGGERTFFPSCAANINDRGTILFRYPTAQVLYQGAITNFDLDAIAHSTSGFSGARPSFVGPLNNSDEVLATDDICTFGACLGGTIIVQPPRTDRVSRYGSTSRGVDLNDSGDIAANSFTGTLATYFDGEVNSTILRFSGSKLNTPNSCRGSLRGLNNQGLAVGQIFCLRSAFLWEWKTGHVYRVVLPDEGWVIDSVVRINDAGQIIAHGVNSRTGQRGAVLLQPAP